MISMVARLRTALLALALLGFSVPAALAQQPTSVNPTASSVSELG